MSRRRILTHVVAVPLAGIIAACGPSTASDPEPDRGTEAESEQEPDRGSEPETDQEFPDVVAADVQRTGDTWRVSATISSPYDHPDRYADAFRVRAPDGTVLGIRELLHHHANEQPFTRTLEDVRIPDDVKRVIVEARDLVNGWGGEVVVVEVPRP